MKKIEKLCKSHNWGNLKREPEMVTGGLMHKMYHVLQTKVNMLLNC